MPLNKDKKSLYVAVLIIAGVALVADRVFFGDSETAGLQAADASTLAVNRDGGSAAPAVQRSATSSLAELLAGRRESAGEAFDAFDARRVFSDGVEAEIEVVGDSLMPVEAFLASHKLRSVIVGDGTSGAVRVGRRTLRLGDELDGYRLDEIRPRMAIFVAGDVRAELRLDDAQQSAD